MRINARIRQLVSERMALLVQAHEIKQSLQAIPRVKHIKMEFLLQPIRELSLEEQAKIIRMENKSR